MNVTYFKSKFESFGRKKKSWENQDIADFYRAVEILKQAGLNTEVDSGITDEGDPWFVFLRPENGEVVAHFAHIDGLFIAVSSVNHQVYKGNNIRGIIDQMLLAYPTLLPQSKGGAKLYLHPTAAISAFLAAAFILTVDGVKESDIGGVIFNAIPDKRDGGVDDNVYTGSSLRSDISSSARFEATKGVIPDTAASNANLAVLGAALIAHQLSLAQNDQEISENKNDVGILTKSSEEIPDSEMENPLSVVSAYRHFEQETAQGDVTNVQTLTSEKDKDKNFGGDKSISTTAEQFKVVQNLFPKMSDGEGQSKLVNHSDAFLFLAL